MLRISNTGSPVTLSLELVWGNKLLCLPFLLENFAHRFSPNLLEALWKRCNMLKPSW
jgi:hypothetical protein